MCDVHTHRSPLGRWAWGPGCVPGPKSSGTDHQRRLSGEVGSGPRRVCHDCRVAILRSRAVWTRLELRLLRADVLQGPLPGPAGASLRVWAMASAPGGSFSPAPSSIPVLCREWEPCGTGQAGGSGRRVPWMFPHFGCLQHAHVCSFFPFASNLLSFAAPFGSLCSLLASCFLGWCRGAAVGYSPAQQPEQRRLSLPGLEAGRAGSHPSRPGCPEASPGCRRHLLSGSLQALFFMCVRVLVPSS